MKRRNIERALDSLIKEVPAGIRRAGLKPNACILAARMGVEGLRAQGIRARPLSVRLRVFNATYMRLFEAGGEHPTRETEREWADAGAWEVCIGYGSSSPTPGYDGHVVIVADERYLVDLTASQAQRLQRSITMEPFWIEARDLVRNKPVLLSNDDGTTAYYEPHAGDKRFLRMPAWSAYRVSVRGGRVISERTGPLPDAAIAPEVIAGLPIQRETERQRK